MTETPALHELSPRGREIVSDYYAAGWTAGLAAGWDRCEQSYTEHHDVVRQILAHLGQPFDALAERRGQPERAERHRRLMQSRGVA